MNTDRIVEGIFIGVGTTVVLFLLALFIFPNYLGIPVSVTFGGIQWGTSPVSVGENKDQSQPLVNHAISLQPKDLIKIQNLTSRKKIFTTDENATIDFSVTDPLNINYSIAVDWIQDNKRIKGWSSDSNISQPFHSWYSDLNAGEYEVQVSAKWDYNNEQFSTDEIIQVRVI